MAHSSRSESKSNSASSTDAPCSIGTLPPEILSEIFDRLRALIPSHLMRKKGRAEVICLLLVCKTWHTVALSTPGLWADLGLRTGSSGTRYDEVVKWFNRAKDVPKSLAYHPSVKCHLNDPTLVKILALGPSLARFQISFDSASCLFGFTRAVTMLNDQQGSRPWDTITSLTLGVSLDRASESDQKSLFEQLPPNLTILHLYLHSPDEVPLHFSRGILGGLKEFTISCDWDSPHPLAFLQHCVNAKIVTIESNSGPHTWNMDHPNFPPNISQPSPLTLPNVRTLTINIQCPSAYAALLPFLHFPNIVDLRIRTPSRTLTTEKAVRGVFRAFKLLTQSSASPTLRGLTLFHPSPSSSDFRCVNAQGLFDILAGLPLLSHLVLDHITFDTRRFLEIHREFRGQVGAPKLLPCLEHLEFVRSGGASFNLESVFDFAKSRRKHKVYKGHIKFQQPPDSLKKLTFRRWHDPEGQLAAEYRTSPSVQQLRDFFGVAVEKF